MDEKITINNIIVENNIETIRDIKKLSVEDPTPILKELFKTDEDMLVRDHTISQHGNVRLWSREAYPLSYFKELGVKMGVKLKDIIEPEKIDFKDFEGRAVSIDAFNTLYQFLSTIRQRDGRPLTDENGNVTSHLSGILYRNSSMIEKDIKPIYVFDGKSSELKSDTQPKRREIREEAEQIYKEALAEGDTEKARKFAMRSSKLSPEIIESSKKLLTLMGIPYVEAKGEGEAQAAYLVANGDAYAVASQDYDCLLFGAKRVVRNLAVNSNLGNLEYYELNRVLKELKISRQELIDMGILIGTDFSRRTKRSRCKNSTETSPQRTA